MTSGDAEGLPCALAVRELETAKGTGRAHVHLASEPVGLVALSHGAGGSIDAADLQALAEALPPAGWSVALVEMPWRVAGRRVASPAATLDAAWVPMMAALRQEFACETTPFVVGGRSNTARVAARTAPVVQPDGLLALSFPLVPPGKDERASRAGELATAVATGVPLLVVQGERDPFGGPDAVRAVLAAAGAVDDRVNGSSAAATVVGVPGAHSLTQRPVEAVSAVREHLERVRSSAAGRSARR